MSEPSSAPEGSSAMDVYAEPYIPLALKQVNEAPAHQRSCAPASWINFNAYVAAFAGAFLKARSEPASPSLLVDHTSPATLDEHNYDRFFQTALQVESQAAEKNCETYSLYQVPLWQNPEDVPRSTYRLAVPGLRESFLPVEVGDIVRLRQIRYDGFGNVVTASGIVNNRGQPLPGRLDICYNAVVWLVDRFNETLHLRIDRLLPMSMLFNACFMPQSTRHAALGAAIMDAAKGIRTDDSWLRSMLFPEPRDGVLQTALNSAHHHLNLIDPIVNREQVRAITTVLREDYGHVPYIVSGPPGTGKTKTIVEMALQMLTHDETKHILLCAPSDPAADTLVRRLSRHLTPKELLRLNSPARSFPEVPNAVLPYCHVDDSIFSIPAFSDFMRKQIIVTTTRDAELLRRARLTNADLFDHEFAVYSAYHPRSPCPVSTLHWDALIMDESAQATEPEAVIPLLVVAPPFPREATIRMPRVVLVGDQNQLGPRTASKAAFVQRSLFERLLERPLYRDHPLARAKGHGGHMPRLTSEMLPLPRPPFTDLIRNYRSHPAILAIPSSLFYYDTLEPAAEGTCALLDCSEFANRDLPLLFHDNREPDDIEQDGGGWYNVAEAKLAIDLAQSFAHQGVSTADICIMSPFRAQVKVLRNRARSTSYAMARLNIGPLEAFQGLEFRVVIVCTTRTRNRFIEQDIARGLGVIHEPRRFNVALTRAKHAMIVIGNPEVLEVDLNWTTFLAFCRRNDAWRADEGIEWQPSADQRISTSRLEKQMRARQEATASLSRGVRRLGLTSDPESAAYEAGVAAEQALADPEQLS